MPTLAPTPLENRRMRRATLGALFAATLALNAGCGGGSDSAAAAPAPQAPSPPPSAATSTGRFVDSAVGNLGYACSGLSGVANTSGVTDALGQFDYVAGQTCTFSVGGITLGSAPAASLLTPVSLVSGATAGVANTAVTNIVRFLMSIDNDSSPDNGIAIAAEVNTALASHTLNFASATFDADAATLVNTAIAGRALVAATVANAHLDLTLLGLYAGGYACTYRGPVNGVDTLLGNVSISIADGVITGAGTPIGSPDTFEVGGSITSSGAANLTAGTTSTGATFQGDFITNGTTAGTTGSGTWDDPEAGSGTWSCQHS